VRLEGIIFTILVVFFIIVTPIYWYLSEDPTGTTALVLTFGLSALVAFYLLYTSRKVYPRPEDRLDGEIEEMAGEYGFFSPHSWWPLACAGSGALVMLGLVFAWWLFIVGVALGAVALIGLIFEYYRGESP
jgi:Cytochrome c oxidase subunit IV